ncbi:L-amino acid amidase [Hyphodiscus hymeniophilus]|uniref:L-amino acid amidase n=1 Tax=Hyphodiscus hymeniophilus TaxID=353542 RepID=A0A9P6VQP4_9HELO|nr:L-amino acid amidase [Hyphodiscus hymeniophilus]
MASGSPYPTLQPTKQGTIPFLIPGAGKECFTFYKIFGHLTATNKTPCVLVHGGPGLAHDYMLSYLPLFEKFGIPLVLYDQMGNGLSTHLPEKKGDEDFWTEELFHLELSNLMSALGLDESGYDLVGHSWGGMMGSTFAAKNPKGLRKLVLSNAPATMQSWIDAYNLYRSQLPQELQDALKRCEDSGTEQGDEYQGIMMNEFYKRHMMSLTPWPEEFLKAFEWAGKDDTVTSTMMGLSEFKVAGSTANWSAAEAVDKITVPTLVINGKDEGASDESIRPFVEGIKGAKWVKFEKSAHMPVYEERERYFDVLNDFLEGK